MKRFQNIHKKITLSRAEKERMRASLHVLMRERPVIASLAPARERYGFRAFFTRPLRAATAALVLVLLTGGGVVFAAEGSIPGDMLYPVKVNVTEKIKAALATTPVAKAKVQVELANERLQEAETLAAQGKLTATTTVELTADFKRHVDAIEATSTDRGAQDALAVLLEAHQRVLGRLMVRATTSAEHLGVVVEKVLTHAENITLRHIEKKQIDAKENSTMNTHVEHPLATSTAEVTAATSVHSEAEANGSFDATSMPDTANVQRSSQAHERAVNEKFKEVEQFINDRSEHAIDEIPPSSSAGIQIKTSL